MIFKLKVNFFIFLLLKLLNGTFCAKCNIDETSKTAICEDVNNFSQISNQIPTNCTRLVILNKIGATVTIPENDECLARIEELDLSKAGNIQLSDSGFKTFLSLIKLIAPNGSFETIQSNWFCVGNVVEYIDMSSNWFQRLKRSYFSSLKNIRELNFSGNDIYGVEVDTFSDNPNLEILDLSDTYIDNLVDMGFMPRLRHLNLYNNDILDVPNDVFVKLPALETISLASNSIQRVRDRAFGGLNNLRKLNLSINSLREINIYAYDHSTLQVLDLSTNDIKVVKANSFPSLRNLRILDLSNNSILRLEKDCFNGIRLLRNLFLHNNLLEELPPKVFSNMPLIEEIYLNQNALKSFSGDVFGEIDIPLRILSLQNNSLCAIQPKSFLHTPSLEYLYLGYNNLKTLDGNLFSNILLKTLQLQHNLLEEISETLNDDLSSVEELLINHNQLSFLPDGRILFNLKKMTVEGNPWQCPCFTKIFHFITSRRIEYHANENQYYHGAKPICVFYTSEDSCIRDVELVRKYIDAGLIFIK